MRSQTNYKKERKKTMNVTIKSDIFHVINSTVLYAVSKTICGCKTPAACDSSRLNRNGCTWQINISLSSTPSVNPDRDTDYVYHHIMTIMTSADRAHKHALHWRRTHRGTWCVRRARILLDAFHHGSADASSKGTKSWQWFRVRAAAAAARIGYCRAWAGPETPQRSS